MRHKFLLHGVTRKATFQNIEFEELFHELHVM